MIHLGYFLATNRVLQAKKFSMTAPRIVGIIGLLLVISIVGMNNSTHGQLKEDWHIWLNDSQEIGTMFTAPPPKPCHSFHDVSLRSACHNTAYYKQYLASSEKSATAEIRSAYGQCRDSRRNKYCQFIFTYDAIVGEVKK